MSGMLRRSTVAIALVAGVLAVAAVPAIRHRRPHADARSARNSGTIVASIRAEPRSFNRYTSRDLSTTVLTYLMHSGLVHVNRVTNQLEPDLAERWELLPDGRTFRLHLRPNVQFSDGAPFSAADVVFSFNAIYDEKAASVLADSLQVRGKPLVVAAEDALTVTIRFPPGCACSTGFRSTRGIDSLRRWRRAASDRRGGSRLRLRTSPALDRSCFAATSLGSD
jgi:ABC-type transport system substrate-binding protein